jgi:hypothetical protein
MCTVDTHRMVNAHRTVVHVTCELIIPSGWCRVNGSSLPVGLRFAYGAEKQGPGHILRRLAGNSLPCCRWLTAVVWNLPPATCVPNCGGSVRYEK